MENRKSYYAIIPANVRYDKDLTANAKLLYGEITALCNEKGFCWASNDYFAKLYGVSKTSVSKWISALIEKGYLDREIEYKAGTKEILNRYLRIVTYPIEEKLNTPIEEKLKENNTSNNNTLNNTYTNICEQSFLEKEMPVLEEFQKLWEIYPRKEGKRSAFKHYKTAKKEGATYEQVKDGIERYKAFLKKMGWGYEYTKMGSTYFHGRLWEDEYEQEVKQNDNMGTADDDDCWYDEVEQERNAYWE